MQIINANIDEPQYYKNNLDKTQNATLAMKVSLKDAAICAQLTLSVPSSSYQDVLRDHRVNSERSSA